MTDLVKQLEELWLEKPQKMTWAEMQEVTDRAAARIAELEAALKPFAEMVVKPFDDLGGISKITVGDLRAARAALEKKND